MWILVMSLLLGLVVAAWGFMACFLPERWQRVTAAMGFIRRWTYSQPTRLDSFLRLANRALGFVFLVAGLGFAYLGGLETFRVLTGRGTIHPVSRAETGPPNSSTLPLTVLSVFMLVLGSLMAGFPEGAMFIFGRFWPPWRSVPPAYARRVRLYIRLSGVVIALLAAMSLTH
jgi:hypothetical protein